MSWVPGQHWLPDDVYYQGTRTPYAFGLRLSKLRRVVAVLVARVQPCKSFDWDVDYDWDVTLAPPPTHTHTLALTLAIAHTLTPAVKNAGLPP